MRAIILAAGEGKRLAPITFNKPKPLLEIKGRSLLENTIYYLKKSNIHDIVVITGYKHHLFEALQKKYQFKQIVFEDFKNTNSAGSLKYAINEITKGTIIMNGDLFITQSFVEYFKTGVSQFLAQRIPQKMLSWGYLVDENCQLLDIDTNATSGYGDGIAFFDNEDDLPFLKKALLSCTQEDYWEQCVLNSLHKINFYISFCDNFYTEIDSLKDAIDSNLITPEEIAKQCADDGKATKLFSITNINYKIQFLGATKVLRIPRIGRDKTINTHDEKTIYALLSQDITPKSEFFDNDLKMTTFLDGYYPLSFEDLQNNEILALIVQKIKQLHSYKHNHYPLLPTISLIKEIHKYEQLAHITLTTKIEHKFILDIARTLDKKELVLCHRDLQLPNILYNGSNIQFIDFEYAAFSPIAWELGNLSAELELDKKQIYHIIALYGEEKITYEEIIQGQLLSNYIWALWSWIYERIDLGRSYLTRFHNNLQYLMHNT